MFCATDKLVHGQLDVWLLAVASLANYEQVVDE
jgi:hypothetical protein